MQTPAGPPPPPPLPAAQASPRYNPWAIVSVAFGASTVIGTWCVGGIVAVITGHVARHQIKRTGEAGANLALIGLIAGYTAIGLTLLFILAYVAFFVFLIVFAATHPGSTPRPTPSVN
ncbi:MAG TPA: DUF4190 domain-containing protein [Candidatus Dormibacteraeota bacterium]|nr:DUF4190 domain-containing protein [Candidatus Dormibacteraeota bacterium]